MKRIVLMMIVVASFVSMEAFGQVKLGDGKLSGLFYLDFYTVGEHHDATIDGKDGIWIRRVYLTYDHKLGDRAAFRIRWEGKDKGNFSSTANKDSFAKDAWVRYSTGGYTIMFGLIPTLTWEPNESTLGYRGIEKTPFDLFRMGSARDKGISVEKNLDAKGLTRLALMLGDGSGTKTANGDPRVFSVRVSHKANNTLTLDLYGDYWERPAGVEWYTVKGEAFVTVPEAKIGLLAGSQRRESPSAATIHLTVGSIYLELTASKRIRPFVRADVVSDAVPGADRIEFLKLATTGKPTFYVAGIRFKINDHFEIVPNVKVATYRQKGANPAPGRDVFYQLTVLGKF